VSLRRAAGRRSISSAEKAPGGRTARPR